MSAATNVKSGLSVREVENAVTRALCEYAANGAGHISMSALLDSSIGESVTLGDAIAYLMRYSSEWRMRAKEAGVL